MGAFEDFGGTFRALVGQVESSALPQLLGAALRKSKLGDLQALVDSMAQSGLGDRVRGWVDQHPGLPISAPELGAALGRDNVQRLSSAIGLPPDSALTLFADKLPEAVAEAGSRGDITL